MKLSELERNDVPAAVNYARARIAAKGYLPPEECKILASLQDDPTKLFAELKKIVVLVTLSARTSEHRSGK